MSRIQEALTRAKSQLETVEKNTPATVDEFTALGIVRDGIYKNLEDAIQNIVDACALILKERKLGILTHLRASGC